MSEPSRHLDSHWWSGPTPEFPAFEGELDADVVVVGGGIAGLTLAYTLIEQGGSVALFEGAALAGSASGRNAGFLLAAPSEPYQEMIAIWGRPGARAVLETGRRSHQRVRKLSESLGIACDYRASGSFRLARTEEEAEDIRASLPALAADGFPMLETPVSEAVPLHAVARFAAAFVTREDGEFHPVRFLHGLARAAIDKGGRLFANSPVVWARWRDGGWEVRTERGVARARTLVLASNAFAPRLCPALEPLIKPRRGQMLATAPLETTVAPMPVYAHWGYQYWRQTPEGRLLIGGWRDLDLDAESGFDDRPSEKIQAAIERGLAELVPGGAPIERRWAGIMGFARDGRPLVGWLDADHHLAILAGFTGHGMGLAAACSEGLSELLGFRPAPAIATFDPGRFAQLRQDREGLTVLGAAT